VSPESTSGYHAKELINCCSLARSFLSKLILEIVEESKPLERKITDFLAEPIRENRWAAGYPSPLPV